MQEIGLYWWTPPLAGRINLGDEINRHIVAAVSGKTIVHKKLHECDLVAIGSILQSPFRPEHYGKRTTPLHIWGTGLMKPDPIGKAELIHIASVRGILSRCLTEEPQTLPVGDPGLIVSDIWRAPPAKTAPIGIIPHWVQVNEPFVGQMQDALPGSVVIDLTDPDVPGTLARIAGCERILSSSLHGLIFADSYKIPNAWMKTRDVHAGKNWKFFDYFSSVGRDRFTQVDVLPNAKALASDSDFWWSSHHQRNIDAAKKSVWSSFPSALK